MTKPTYLELLKHPLWQKKRLEILQENDFACSQCDSTDKTLHVHHGYYEKGRMPWEYPNESLHCLCEECHRIFQAEHDELLRLIGYLPVCLIPFMRGYVSAQLGSYPVAHKLTAGPYAGDVLEGIATGMDGNPNDYLQEVRGDVITHNGLDYEVAFATWWPTAHGKK